MRLLKMRRKDRWWEDFDSGIGMSRRLREGMAFNEWCLISLKRERKGVSRVSVKNRFVSLSVATCIYKANSLTCKLTLHQDLLATIPGLSMNILCAINKSRMQ